MEISKKRMETILKDLIKKRGFACRENSVAQKEFDTLAKKGLLKKVKDRIKSNCDGEHTWYLYKCTTKAEKLYQKIKKRD